MKKRFLTIIIALCALAGTASTAKAETVINSIPLTLEAIADGEITVLMPRSGMQYSVNGGAKTAVTASAISVSANDVVAFYGNGTSITGYYVNEQDVTKIQCSADCYIYGNVMSLVDEYGFATNTTLTRNNTFTNLFLNNTHIKIHSDKELVLPATMLTEGCYSSMFKGCTGLTKAPELPATTLTPYCYGHMFFGCTNLNYVKCLATDLSAEGCTYEWLKNVVTTGTFVKAENTAWAAGISGIPNGWTTNGLDKQDLLPLTLEAIASGTITISYPQTGMKYSINRYSKMTATDSDITIYVSKGDVVEFYGNGTDITSYNGTHILCSADCYIYGNIMSLVDETSFVTNKTLTGEYTFRSLFQDNSHLKNHSNKELLLPATTLQPNCYSNMFFNCPGLTKAPALPATTLQPYCYNSMFSGCTGLTKAPELPATTLQPYCYNSMFAGCTNLNNVICLATNISAYACTENWLDYGVAETGTFVKEANSTWTTGSGGIPSGWTVVEALPDNANNTTDITALATDGQSHNIMLLGRTLYKDGNWNTLCLPFNASLTGDLVGATLMELDTEAGSYDHITGLDNGTLYLNFKSATSIVAGKPYIIKWASGDNIENPVFSGVTIDKTEHKVTFTGGSFKGTYSPVTWPEENKSILFLGEKNTLYYPKANAHVNAFRAYFELDPTAHVREFNLNFDEQGTTSLREISNEKLVINNYDYYTLDGRKLDGKPTRKGLYIIGNKKVVIK